MKTELLPRRAEFVRHQPKNFILVENTEFGVVIRATVDNYSDRQKQMFIREIAAEGFIPDHLQRFSPSCKFDWAEVKWVIDDRWASTYWRSERMGSPVMKRILLGAAFLWLSLICLLLGGFL